LDAGDAPAKFVFLGDYIDRGPDSRGVIEFLIKLQSQRPTEIICLAGNHEELALAALRRGAFENQWLRNGGGETLRSYGIASAADLPPQHVAWLDALPTYHDDGRRFFVHAGINPDRPLNQQDPYDFLWIREPFLSDERDHGRYIVHGHTPLRTGIPDQRPNRLNIDTAAVLGGPLTAAVFNDKQTEPIRFLQAD
jgi:serine/threonine protein phosphatase 1